jgi:hypothetical protein
MMLVTHLLKITPSQGFESFGQEPGDFAQRSQGGPRCQPGMRSYWLLDIDPTDCGIGFHNDAKVEAHPYLPQNGLHKLCRERGIHMTAYSRELIQQLLIQLGILNKPSAQLSAVRLPTNHRPF